MPYTHITFATLKTQIANRLGDSGKVFWVDDELGRIATEALRTFGILSGFWRQRQSLTTVSGTSFYDLSTSLSTLSPTVTDRDLIKDIQYALQESVSSQTSWSGTEMFTYDDVVRAIERRRNQFLADTGVMLTRSVIATAPPPQGRIALSQSIIAVRRAAWYDTDNRYRTLWPEDEQIATFSDLSWGANAGTPLVYSVLAPPPLTIQLIPPPSDSGTLELITVDSGSALDPATQAGGINIPDDLSPFIKWGALADLLGRDGQARDPVRAAFCESRYQQGVAVARTLAAVVHSEINGVAVIPSTLADLDAGVLDWQNVSGTPSDLMLAGWNLCALHPVPDGVYSLTLDVVENTPVPTLDTDYIEVGREQLDPLIDYCEHLAMFKVGGAEFAVTERQATNFLTGAVASNQRLAASARYAFSAREQSQANRKPRPYRVPATALGSVPEEVRT